MEPTSLAVSEAHDEWELVDEELDGTQGTPGTRGCPWIPFPRCVS